MGRVVYSGTYEPTIRWLMRMDSEKDVLGGGPKRRHYHHPVSGR